MKTLITLLLIVLTGNVMAISEKNAPRQLVEFMRDNFSGTKFTYKKEPFGFVGIYKGKEGKRAFVTTNKAGNIQAVDIEVAYEDLPTGLKAQFACVKVKHIMYHTTIEEGHKEYQIKYVNGAYSYHSTISESMGIITHRENRVLNSLFGGALITTIILLFMSTQ